MRISVILCTCNKKLCLPKAVESLLQQDLPPQEYEIIIVDNASTDGTKEIAREFARENPRVCYVYQPRPGLSISRNYGLRQAKADYVAYIDDDAYAPSQWLSSLLKAFESVRPRPAMVGGPVRLDWQGQKPSWVPEEFISLYTCLDYGEAGFFLTEAHYLVGTNMAFSKSDLEAIGGFKTFLGRRGASLLSGEETAAMHSLLRQGKSVYYQPKAMVSHFVVPERCRRMFILKRVFADGISQSLLDYDQTEGRLSLLIKKSLYDLRMSLNYFAQSFAMQGGKKKNIAQALKGIRHLGRLCTELKLISGKIYKNLKIQSVITKLIK